MADVLRLEMRAVGVTVGTVHPVIFRTAMIGDTLFEPRGRAAAQDFAYQPGGHAPAMKRARELDTHRAGVYLQVRPLASTGSLGIDQPALPDLPDADR